jgi:hypothetical protein
MKRRIEEDKFGDISESHGKMVGFSSKCEGEDLGGIQVGSDMV